MKKLNIFSFLILILIFNACATFTQKECETMDWSLKGAEAALEGKNRNEMLPFYQRACGKEYGMPPDEIAFVKGYNYGLKSFCSSENGLRFGQSGGKYQGTCAQHGEAEFLKTYQIGKLDFTSHKLEELQSTVGRLEDEVQGKDKRIKELEKQLEELMP